jgi:hypothetical protein
MDSTLTNLPEVKPFCEEQEARAWIAVQSKRWLEHETGKPKSFTLRFPARMLLCRKHGEKGGRDYVASEAIRQIGQTNSLSRTGEHTLP